jgi:CheY-like chemotaxis protein
MSLQCLVFCADDKIVRLLRRVLNDLEIGIEHCVDMDSAVRKLTRQRFEAVIVDCTDEEAASQVLKSARSAPCNKRAIAVSIIDGQKALRSAFDLGAHFVLYKPISSERAKSSFRAARALMKRERRRNTRIPVEISAALTIEGAGGEQQVATTDISEGGAALAKFKRSKDGKNLRMSFTLPGTEYKIECAAEMAWENAGRQTGVRFVDLAPEARKELVAWLNRHSPEIEKDDPPVPCKLSDLSLGGCYLETSSPFPVRTRLLLSMRVADLELQVEGKVRVMHPEIGLGIEFTKRTQSQRDRVEKFIQALVNGGGDVPDLMVQPEGIENDNVVEDIRRQVNDENEDPLLDLFRKKAELSSQDFHTELRNQRRAPQGAEPPVLA